MGPRIDLSVRRMQTADEEMMKYAMKRAKLVKGDVEKGLGKKRKNVETDEMGDKVGRIHLGKQDLGKMQGRKMKGLKVARLDKPPAKIRKRADDDGEGMIVDEKET